MSIRLTQPNAFADLGEVWLRDQLARLSQKHVQFGGHYRVDADALLARLASTARTAKAMARTAKGERIRRATVDAIEFCSRLDGAYSHVAVH